jgi:hypothetical protein
MGPYRRLVAVFLVWLVPAWGTGKLGAEAPATQTVSCTFRIRIAKPHGTGVTLTVLVPNDLPGRQQVMRLVYSSKPERIFEDNGNRYARFVLDPADTDATIAVAVRMRLYRHDLDTLSCREENEKKEPARALKPWLAHEQYLEKDAAPIRAAARARGGKDELETLRNIAVFVGKTLRYSGYNAQDVGALEALKVKHGDCTEFSDLFVALCRAQNIPARVWEGYLTTAVRKDDTSKHNWVEVYTRKYGWVPFDPLYIAKGVTTFERMKPIYVYLSPVRNDARLGGYHFYYYQTTGSKVRVSDTFSVRRQGSSQD